MTTKHKVTTHRAHNAQGCAVAVTIPTDDVRDQLQPFTVGVLVEAALGHIDLNAFAIDTLAARGLDPSTGEWVGFEKAKQEAEVAKARLGIL